MGPCLACKQPKHPGMNCQAARVRRASITPNKSVEVTPNKVGRQKHDAKYRSDHKARRSEYQRKYMRKRRQIDITPNKSDPLKDTA